MNLLLILVPAAALLVAALLVVAAYAAVVITLGALAMRDMEREQHPGYQERRTP